MDIGMYGHGQHNNYGSSETSYFNYPNESCQSTHTPHQITPNHYPTPAYHYEEPPFLYTSSEAADTPPSPQELNYYPHHHHPPSQTLHQENPIISTETGLSYTNLDYGTQTPNMYHPQSIYSDPTYQRTHPETLLREDNHPIHQTYLHENKYVPHQVDGDGYPHSHLVPSNGGSASCMEYQHHARFKEEGHQNVDLERHHHQNHHLLHGISSVPQSQPVIPTYKWMQVKRNVPKPSGKHSLFLVSFKQLYKFLRRFRSDFLKMHLKIWCECTKMRCTY